MGDRGFEVAMLTGLLFVLDMFVNQRNHVLGDQEVVIARSHVLRARKLLDVLQACRSALHQHVTVEDSSRDLNLIDGDISATFAARVNRRATWYGELPFDSGTCPSAGTRRQLKRRRCARCARPGGRSAPGCPNSQR